MNKSKHVIRDVLALTNPVTIFVISPLVTGIFISAMLNDAFKNTCKILESFDK